MRAVLIDLDGVLYQGDTPIPGADAAIRWFQDAGVPHLFVALGAGDGHVDLRTREGEPITLGGRQRGFSRRHLLGIEEVAPPEAGEGHDSRTFFRPHFGDMGE